jgi:hypothetical protein
VCKNYTIVGQAKSIDIDRFLTTTFVHVLFFNWVSYRNENKSKSFAEEENTICVRNAHSMVYQGSISISPVGFTMVIKDEYIGITGQDKM